MYSRFPNYNSTGWNKRTGRTYHHKLIIVLVYFFAQNEQHNFSLASWPNIPFFFSFPKFTRSRSRSRSSPKKWTPFMQSFLKSERRSGTAFNLTAFLNALQFGFLKPPPGGAASHFDFGGQMASNMYGQQRVSKATTRWRCFPLFFGLSLLKMLRSRPPRSWHPRSRPLRT